MFMNELIEQQDRSGDMKCENCVFWHGSAWKRPVVLGICQMATHIDEAFRFERIDGVVVEEEVDPTQMMYVTDASSYHAALYTKAEFFCAHYKEKR